VNGIVVLVPGYQSAWVGQLWDRPQLLRVPLDRLSEEESREHLQRLEALLAKSRLRGSELSLNELELFDSIADFDIEVAFDERDRRLVGEFLRIEQ